MKKKLSSLITAMFVLLVCVFASACSKYDDLEFRILYAYSANAEDWYDGTNGISINYNPETIEGEEDSSLIFDEYGEAKLYIKIEVKNVNSKHIDTITVTSMGGLGFSSTRVEQNEVLALPISGNVNTTLKFYENNSGKQHKLPMVVSRELTGIDADLSTKPAVAIGDSIKLYNLENLTFLPYNETNQKAVTYSVESVGHFDGGRYQASGITKETLENHLVVNKNATLNVKESFSEVFGNNNCVVKIVATSVYHDGSDGKDAITAEFYVYIVENEIASPEVYFEDNDPDKTDVKVGSQVNIYDNGGSIYSKSTIKVDRTKLNSIYKTGVASNVNGESLNISVALYVLNEEGKYVKFNQSKHQSGINGLCIKENEDGTFEFSVADREFTKTNYVKITYEIEGLDFSSSDGKIVAEKTFEVKKGVLPNSIIVNDTLTLQDGDPAKEEVVYGTTNKNYKGLELKLAANPNEDKSRVIELIYGDGLIVTDKEGKALPSSKILTGTTILVKFADNVSEKETLTLKTLKIPDVYNGNSVSARTDEDYVIVSYSLSKIVTADAFEFLPYETATESKKEVLVNANSNDFIYVKTYFTGVNLNTETVTLNSSNENFLFTNNSTEISLDMATYLSGGKDDVKGKYNIYKVPVKATYDNISTNITISAGTTAIGINETVKVSSVRLMEEEALKGINVNAKTSGIKEFDSSTLEDNASFNFAIAKGDFVEFEIVDGNNSTKNISSIKLSTKTLTEENFASNLLTYNVITNSLFVVNGKIGGKTQVLDVAISYYALETIEETKIQYIVSKTKNVVVQIAVFEAIGNIDVTKITNEDIGFVNEYFTDVSSTEISFESYTSSYGTPASKVVFKGVAQEYGEASQIRVSVKNYDSISPYKDYIEIYFNSAEGEDLDLLASKNVVLNNINGNIKVKLNGELQGINEITLTLQALRFGEVSNTLRNITINIAQIETADRIVVSGDAFVGAEDDKSQNELRLSFIDVATGGTAKTEFSAEIKFDSEETTAGTLRFEDIDTALTHVLYRYKVDENNKFIYATDETGNILTDENGNKIIAKEKISNNFFDVAYINGVVTVKAYKDLDGGIFRLVLATKDSYNPKDGRTLTNAQEEDFETTYAITIRVEDGIKTAYTIYDEDELKLINYNLNKNFALGDNLDFTSSYADDFEMLGVVNGKVSPFTGTLNGSFSGVDIVTGAEKVSTYSISFAMNKTIDSEVYGSLSGLFAVIGDTGVVENITLEVADYAGDFVNEYATGLKVGTLAAVNNGTIRNVNVNLLKNSIDTVNLNGNAGNVDFGGVVGLNYGTITNAKVSNEQVLTISSGAIGTTINVGLVAGTNGVEDSKTGSIAGTYIGKSSLNNFVFDIKADLKIQNNATTGTSTYFVGSVAGTNNGIINGILAGGQISLTDAGVSGALGGIVGNSEGEGNTVTTSTAFGLTLNTESSIADVAGIVGNASQSTINNVKFVSVEIEDSGVTTRGQIYGSNLVAGIVAIASNSTITYASVESFIDLIDNQVRATKETFYTLNGGTTNAGLVASVVDKTDEGLIPTAISTSFVNARIKSTGNIVLTSQITSEENTYFIGKVNGNVLTNNATYSVVDSEITYNKGASTLTVTLSEIMTGVADEDVKAITDWKNADIYIANDDGTYTKAQAYEEGKTYVKVNATTWEEKVKTLVSGTSWEIVENYNIVNINGVDLFFPYLLRLKEIDNVTDITDDKEQILMIVAPKSIKANLDVDYVANNNSVVIETFNIADYTNKITETAIVNYINGAGDRANTYNLIGNKDNEKKQVPNDALFDVDLFPELAQGGYAYEILGSGYSYAYINNQKQIVITKASGNTPIIIRLYSVFDTTVEYYVALYSQALMTDLTLSSSSIFYAGETNYDYEINVYTGQNNKIISLDAKNEYGNNNYSTIFKVSGIAEYLSVDTTERKDKDNIAVTESLLAINSSTYNNMTLNIAEDKDVTTGYYEIVTFALYLDAIYFGTDGEGNLLVADDICLGTVKLKVNLYNSASSIDVLGEDSEITTSDDVSFEVRLTTDFVDKTSTETTYVGVYENSLVTVNEDGEVWIDIDNDRDITNDTGDSIKIKLNVVEGSSQAEDLVIDNNVSHFAELFNIQIVSNLMLEENTDKPIGYKYNVILELKDERSYRSITSNIKLNIIICAASNEEISNEDVGGLEVLIKPALTQTVRIENYVVQSLDVYTDYSTIVANDTVETSIVEPGSLGNVMMIYLEPSYSNVTSASISSSELYVPSLGKNVTMKFTQLVLDKRATPTGQFTTIYGGKNYIQQGNTLQLERVSEKDEEGNDVYTGVICLYVQIEKFIGLEATITAELNVTTQSGSTTKTITRTRDLLTSYLPGTEVTFESERAVNGGYLVQKGTINEIQIKIFGYKFNKNPQLTFAWNIDESTSNYEYVGGSQKIKSKDGTGEELLIGNYISYELVKNFNEITYNSAEDSYTLTLKLMVSEDIPAAFTVSAVLSLTTKDGQLITSNDSTNTLKFYPTNYLVTGAGIDGLSNGRRNIAINKTGALDFVFTTENSVNDLTDEIYADLISYIGGSEEKFEGLFSYYQGGNVKFSGEHPEFETNLNGTKLTITGVSEFTNLITFSVPVTYVPDVNGVYSLRFGKMAEANSYTSANLEFSFTLNIYVVNEDTEILIYDANGFNQMVEGGHYVLMNDITLENVTPVTTKIGSFDGNNRTITINSFAVDAQTSNYGLFASIGTYTVEDQDTEETYQKPTTLKNMIVDYSKFNGTIALNTLTSANVTFGGLVARNNGGLIYNCDVMNLDATKTAEIDVIVGGGANVVFGGLVGVNSGNITNSRVGRSSYTRITATKTTESTSTIYAGGLTFSIYNQETESDSTNNQFSIVSGGFVGQNSGIISSSFVSKTNLYNHSTNETTNKTAGFVGENNGTISYSYVKADDTNTSVSNPYTKDYVVENKGNGIVAGFVYTNSGEINNAYANLELQTKSAYIAGFVFNNTSNGKISECYAATTMNAGSADSNAEQPFVGVNSAGDLLSYGTLENSYYLMRSEIDSPYNDGEGKDIAQGLNEDNFEDSENLTGFVFVLSNSKAEREQGVWSYYTLDNKKRLLPELVTANVIAHSYRFVADEEASEKVLTNAMSYSKGSANNPYTISDVEEFNNVFTYAGTQTSLSGYVRFINNIDFNDDEKAIQTRTNYTLGAEKASTKTSIEGNGMTISGIYLDVGEAVVQKVGLFSEIKNAYIKNLNLEFATPTTDGQFSTTTATYSGGLAGTINNSVIINVNLYGKNTTLTGSNFVGGLAGLVSGTSLIYGVETNLNVKVSSTEEYLYYSQADYANLRRASVTGYSYENYLKKLSYAGGIAGVLDLTQKAGIDHNVQFIDIRGDQMVAKTFDGKTEANIIAAYAGGIAGYANEHTNSFKLRYFTGSEETIHGDVAVGGLFGVNLGSIIASQVTTEEEIQFTYDTEIGKYVTSLETDSTATLDKSKVGNLSLLESYGYVGGLVGISLNGNLQATYAKVGINSGSEIGGLIGLSVASAVSYSYAIPYINLTDNLTDVKAGGLIASAYGIQATTPSRNSEIAEYENLLKYKGVTSKNTDAQFTYSTLIIDNSKLSKLGANVTLDYISADYTDESGNTYIQSAGSSNFTYVYAGTVNYDKKVTPAPTFEDPDKVIYENIVTNKTKDTSKAGVVELYRLFNVGYPDQTIAFQEIFSGWSVIKYWSLEEEKYFPLLNNKSVDNFITIDDGNDFKLLETMPSGKFKVVQDVIINGDMLLNNWVVQNRFEGVLIGEIEGSSRRPIITIEGLTPDEMDSTGFFKQTYNATISNLSFEWNSFDLSQVDKVTMVSGLTCNDTGSLISNVEVRASYGDGAETDGYIVNETNKTISGFGGIVGISTKTNLLGCTFAGKINATLQATVNDEAVYVGGLVGYTTSGEVGSGSTTTASTGEESVSTSSVINNSFVGASKQTSTEDSKTINYPITQFNLTVSTDNDKEIYIGGAVGQADNAAIASVSIGGKGYETNYKYIDINVTLANVAENVYIGGTVGSANDGMLTTCETFTNITLTGSTTESPVLRVGGLAGSYSLSAISSASGISKATVDSTIKTIKVVEDAIDKNLETSVSTQTMLSTGVAELGGVATIKQSIFIGTIDTEGSQIPILYAGGAVAKVNAIDAVDLSLTTTYSTLNVGTESTVQLYAGGLVGKANNIKISYSVAWGRIIPITSATLSGDNSGCYIGGLIGNITASAEVNNSYTTTSIVADSIAGSALQDLKIGALVGAIPDSPTTDSIKFNNVFYSSDLALSADENYVGGTELGTNISARALLNSSNWHTELNSEAGNTTSFWKTITVNGGARLPYLESLEDSIYLLEIITKEVGKTSYDYVEGTVMRPIEIYAGVSVNFDDYASVNNGYNYYFLLSTGDSQPTPTFTGELNGVLIGQDLNYSATFTSGTLSTFTEEGSDYEAIVPKVAKHSAVSNLNVVIPTSSTINFTSGKTASGIIAGRNQGVIFNSSVQGTGITFEGSGNVGLIAGVNNGLISYCYSTAEIISTSVNLGGIVHTNGGKLLSNYFTGYIETEQAVKTAGVIVVFSGNNNYAYNNYMAGVIKGGEGANNFTATEFGATGANIGLGSRNFIDSYSHIGYEGYKYTVTEGHTTKEVKVLTPISTALLMSNDGLDGEWYFAVNEGVFNENIAHFGNNYNYPVYKFNKKQADSSSGWKVNDWKNQLPTGTGTVSSTGTSLSERYSYLISGEGSVGNKSATAEYTNAFKIPHLGVLSSIQGLLDGETSRNYVLIYDIDGNNEVWKAVGTSGEVNGFKLKDTDDNGDPITNGFKGVLVSNKYYNYAEDSGDNASYCLIQNLKENGLFANIQEAYFGSIKLGSFVDLKASGALGTTITEDGQVTVNNVLFDNGTNDQIEISGFVSNIGEEEENYYGALFGEIVGNLNVENLVTFKENEGQKYASLILKGGEKSTSGLIAGKSSGNITVNSDLYVHFSGNKYAGGIIGYVSDGELTLSGCIINLETNNPDEMIGYLGGVAGEINGDEVVEIDNVKINLNPSSNTTESLQFYTNSFGGIAAISSNVSVYSFEILFKQQEYNASSTSTNELILTGDQEQGRYFGLLAGIINDKPLTITTFKQTSVNSISINCLENPSYDDTEELSGTGTLIGKINGDLIIETYNAFNISLKVIGVPNLGGLAGYYETGSIQILEATDNPFKKYQINLTGTTNVGGVFGYCKEDITNEIFKDEYFNPLLPIVDETAVIDESEDVADPEVNNVSNKIANIIVTILVIEDNNIRQKNYGGLFGRLEGNIEGDTTSFEITNNNNIIISSQENSSEGVVYNVGGIAGKWIGNSASTLHNTGAFSSIVNNETMLNEINNMDIDSSSLETRASNVGGIFGYIDSTVATIENVLNKQTVYGYQNVGGLIGYANAGINIINSFSIEIASGENLSYDEEESLVICENINTDLILSGSVFGVINVGGAVGYAGNGVTIQQVYSNANVYGNANVGGLVGFAFNATLKNNYIKATDEKTPVIVKGIYYNYIKDATSSTTIKEYGFIPTSVGGLVGTVKESQFAYNIIEGVSVQSTEESLGAVINTIKNNMVCVDILDASSINALSMADKVCVLNENSEVYFNNITSGYGGFAGTIDTRTITDVDHNILDNYLVNITINAQLGINVGTYYGVYELNEDVSDGEETVVLKAPKIYGEINIDGGYVVGGIVGYLDSSADTANYKHLSNTFREGKATIHLQAKITGYYVGGLVGKTNTNNITGIYYLEQDEGVNIRMHIENGYYVGGLIGIAQVTGNANIICESLNEDEDEDSITSYSLGIWKKYDIANGADEWIQQAGTCNMVVGSNYEHFGGLIGMLKIGKAEASKGFTVEVNGKHSYPFTINTVESSNYADGNSKFSHEEESNGNIVLFAQAFYVNLDKLTIDGSLNYDSYDGVGDYNPLNTSAKGWSKEYTGFKRLQRIIPKAENNGADWDSIVELYDATNIAHVGTVKNLGLDRKSLYSSNGNITNNKGKTTSTSTDESTFPSDHICFTVYEQANSKYTLYSSVGIASLYCDQAEDGTIEKYLKPVDEKACFWDWVGAFFSDNGSPNQLFYIDLSGEEKSKGLTYFNWQTDHITIGNKNGTKTNVIYQNEANKAKYVCYGIDNFLDAKLDGTTTNKAYFIFDVIYENASVNGMKKEDGSGYVDGLIDNYLSASGSIFCVTGILTESSALIQANTDDIDGFAIFTKVVKLLFEIALAMVSGGTSLTGMGMKAGFKAVVENLGKSLLKGVVNFAKKAGKLIWKYAKKHALKLIMGVILSGMLLVSSHKAAVQSYSNFTEPSYQNYGYLSSSYNRKIYYSRQNDKLVLDEESDDCFTNDNGTYVYFSSSRPNDYYVNKYIGYQVECEVDADGKPTKVLGMSAFTDMAIDDAVNNSSDEQAEGFKQFKVTDFEFTEDIVDESGNACKVGKHTETGNYYNLVPKYDMKRGLYYVNSLFGDPVTTKATLAFKPAVYADVVSGVEETLKTPNYITNNGAVYVHGKLNSKASGYDFDKTTHYTDNKLTYNGVQFELNGAIIDKDLATYTNQIMYYKQNSSFSPTTGKHIEGYDYFNTVYYTTSKANYNGDGVQYANYIFKENVSSQEDRYDAYGNYGSDYIILKYLAKDYELSATGTFVRDNSGNYHEIIASNRYSDASDAHQDNNGDYLKVGSNFVLITGNTYNAQEYNYGLFACGGFSAQTEATDLLSNEITMAEGQQIVVEVYPNIFTDPFKKNVKLNVSGKWVYQGMVEVEDSVAFAPEYYLYEGGYMVNEEEISSSDDIEYSSVYLPISKSEYSQTFTGTTDENLEKVGVTDDKYDIYKDTINKTHTISYKSLTLVKGSYDTAGNFISTPSTQDTISYERLVRKWSTYRDYYVVENYDGDIVYMPVTDSYLVKDSVLYVMDYTYHLDENGRLVTIRYVRGSADQQNMYENMYLSNKDVEFYTRYRYVKNGTYLNLKDNVTGWGKYSLIPDHDDSTLNNGLPTSFVESVKVILNAPEKIVKLDSYDKDIAAGSITIE